MARSGGAPSKAVNATRDRKRVEAETTTSITLKRAKNGSAFTRCEGCNKDVAVALISMHDCGLDAKIKMNLQANVVEMATDPVPKKPAQKRKLVKAKEPSEKKVKKQRDPTKPKRPPTAFFLFMEEFRMTYKAAHPDNKKVAMVAKEGGETWKSMTAEEKEPFISKAAELKEQYQKALENPNEDEKAEEESKDDDGGEGSLEKEEEVPVDE